MSWIDFSVRRRAGVGLVAAVVLAAALTVVAPVPALASIAGLVTVTDRTAMDSEPYKAVTVHCPPGKEVIGTAYRFLDPPLLSAAGFVVLDDLIPTATSLRVGAGEVVGPGESPDGTTRNWQVEATVLCATPLRGLEVVSQTSAFGPGADRSVQANCPAGKVVFGAGASLAQGFGQVSIEWLQVRSTFVTAFGTDDDDGFSGAWSVTAYAICAFPIAGHVVVSGLDSEGPNSNSSRAISTFCPAGNPPLGGGWRVDGANGEVYVTSLERLNTGMGMRAHEDASGYSGNWDIDAYAICVTM